MTICTIVEPTSKTIYIENNILVPIGYSTTIDEDDSMKTAMKISMRNTKVGISDTMQLNMKMISIPASDSTYIYLFIFFKIFYFNYYIQLYISTTVYISTTTMQKDFYSSVQQLGLRGVGDSMDKHILLQNIYKGNLATDISTVDYLPTIAI